MSDLAQTIGEHIGTIGGYIALGLMAMISARVKEWYERRKARRGIHTALTSDIRVQNYLASALSALETDRITVTQFHNGEHFASGASVQKLTLTHYTVRDGVTGPTNPNNANELRSTPASFMPQTIGELFKSGYRVCRDFDALDPWVQKYQASNGLRTVILCLIPGAHPTEALGIMAFCWLDLLDDDKMPIDRCLKYAKKAALYL